MAQAWFLLATAWVEAATGFVLLVRPSIPIELLLGAFPAGPEIALVARAFGAALVTIGMASWAAAAGIDSPVRRGVVIGVLFYDVAVVLLLAYAGCRSNQSGIALWPAVALHSAFAAWGGTSLRTRPSGEEGEIGVGSR
jgi:hypothetical protein